jgi:formate transporter
MDPPLPQSLNLDALLPPAMAHKAEEVGVAKAKMNAVTMLSLALLAGAFIAFGAIFSTLATTGAAGSLPYGATRVLAGITFSLGLILVIVGGAELFTGNNLIVMAWAGGKVSTAQLVRNWLLVFAGNFAGALVMVALVLLSRQHEFAEGQVGLNALNIAAVKCRLDPVAALFLGILCNVLVCLAVWLCYSARTTTDKILAIVPPIAAFVAAGFEHSVANMYFVPLGLGLKQFGGDAFWQSIGRSAADYPELTWSRFLLGNLLPVTIGNLLGEPCWWASCTGRFTFAARPSRRSRSRISSCASRSTDRPWTRPRDKRSSKRRGLPESSSRRSATIPI